MSLKSAKLPSLKDKLESLEVKEIVNEVKEEVDGDTKLEIEERSKIKNKKTGK